MKNKILKLLRLIQDNQNGLFKIVVLMILLYWTHIFNDIAFNINWLSTSGIESELNAISDKLDSINMTLINR